MGLSSNSLIHLTGSLENLKGILLEGFKVKYCAEVSVRPSGKLSYAVPMVSFSDIPLSELKNQIANYGNWGIGLSKNDSINYRGLNPVIYMERYSDLNESFKAIYDEILRGKVIQKSTELELHIANIFRFSKMYQGDLIRNGTLKKKNYRFSDEREWRWVPSYKEVPMIILPKKVYDDLDKRKYYNDKLKDMRFVFEPQAIQYIIVKDDEEISEILDLFRKPKFKSLPVELIEKLQTRIITTEQIVSDF